jgi:hypothetical protein
MSDKNESMHRGEVLFRDLARSVQQQLRESIAATAAEAEPLIGPTINRLIAWASSSPEKDGSTKVESGVFTVVDRGENQYRIVGPSSLVELVTAIWLLTPKVRDEIISSLDIYAAEHTLRTGGAPELPEAEE